MIDRLGTPRGFEFGYWTWVWTLILLSGKWTVTIQDPPLEIVVGKTSSQLKLRNIGPGKLLDGRPLGN